MAVLPMTIFSSVFWGLILTLSVAVIILFIPDVIAIVLSIAFIILLVALSRLQFVGLIVAFLIAESLAHFLKRAIFLLGTQHQLIYYGVQFIPTAILGLILIAVPKRFRWKEISLSGKILAGFLGLALLTTLVSTAGIPWLVRLTDAHQQLLPFLMFFVGTMLSLKQFARIGRIMALLAVISVVYGLVQFFGGPTLIESAWAKGTYAYSIQGSKVFDYLEDALPHFRVFSYYPDPLSWGLFLIASFTGGVVAHEFGYLRTVRWLWIAIAVVLGLFATLSRSPWVGFFTVLLIYILLGWRSFRRPWLVFGVVLCGFAVVVIGGNYILQRFFIADQIFVVENPVLARYLTIGTLSARTRAWDLLKEAVTTNSLLGNGYGYSSYFAGRFVTIEARNVLRSHNFLVALVLSVGLPGCILFLGFYFQWLREGMLTFHRATGEHIRKVIRWLIAFSVGFFITGYFSGPNFMNYQFFLMMGTLSGYTIRTKREAFND